MNYQQTPPCPPPPGPVQMATAWGPAPVSVSSTIVLSDAATGNVYTAERSKVSVRITPVYVTLADLDKLRFASGTVYDSFPKDRTGHFGNKLHGVRNRRVGQAASTITFYEEKPVGEKHLFSREAPTHLCKQWASNFAYALTNTDRYELPLNTQYGCYPIEAEKQAEPAVSAPCTNQYTVRLAPDALAEKAEGSSGSVETTDVLWAIAQARAGKKVRCARWSDGTHMFCIPGDDTLWWRQGTNAPREVALGSADLTSRMWRVLGG